MAGAYLVLKYRYHRMHYIGALLSVLGVLTLIFQSKPASSKTNLISMVPGPAAVFVGGEVRAHWCILDPAHTPVLASYVCSGHHCIDVGGFGANVIKNEGEH
jgi:hypothetical protein